MAIPDLHLHLVDHPTERLVGRAPALVALRAQIRHLAGFDTVGSPHVPTLLLQGETGTGKGLVARVIHDSGPRASGPFVEVNCAAIPDTMLEAELFGFEPGAFTDAKRAKPGLFEAASGGTLLLDEIDALPLALQGKLLTAIESKQVRRLGAVAARAVDVKLIAASNAVLAESVASGRFRADLYHRLAVVVLALPPLRARGEDIVLLAEALLRHYTAAHGVPAKRLSAIAHTWLREYLWPGNVRELSHVMERVTLLHVGAEVDAETLTSLCQPLVAPQPPVGIVRQPREPVPQETLPAEAEQIRQALVQSGGNVSRAARLLGVSRDTIRYRMQRYGIARPHLGVPAPAASPRASGAGAGRPSSRRDAPPPEAQLQLTAPLAQQEATPPPGSLQHGATHDAAIESHAHTPEPSWEQKPVAVLALELSWPDDSGVEFPRYDLWTERARWEEAIRDKVHAFGGVLVEHTASRLVWVFGVPQGLEQLPQRAVHSALAIRQMVVDASALEHPPCPMVRLAVHLGTVRVDYQAADPTVYMLAVGETLTLPVRLLGQAEPGAIVISPEGGRLVDGWVALEERPLQLRTGDPARVGGYVVLGVSPGRETWAGRRHPTRSPLVGRERKLLLLDAIIEQVKAGRGQVVSLVGAPGMGKSRLLNEFRQRVSGQGIRYAEGQCLAYGTGTPYLPVVDMLRDHCGIAADDSPETRLAKVCTSLQQAGLDPDPRLPFLLPLLGLPVEADQLAPLSAEARKARTFEAMRQLFLTSSHHHPLVLAVEDLHWIDPTSEDLLASLVDGLAGGSILMLTTFRPGYRPRWLDKSYATQIALQPLSPDDSREVVGHALRDTALPPMLEQQLLARAEGNPFFLEELGVTYQARGDYRRAIDYLRQTLVSLDGVGSHERFGRVFLPSVLSHAYLTWSHAELGMFAEGRVLGEEGLRIAEAVGQPGSLMVASWGIGLLFLRQGDLPRALRKFERAMGLCQDMDIPLWLPRVATVLGSAYTLAGRAADAVPMLMQALERMTATEMGSNQVQCCLSLGEAHLRAGHLEEAHALAKRALALAQEHQERGHQAYALRLVGEIAARGEPPESEQSEADYQHALVMANELGMRPLAAHCHLGLGRLYRQMGRGVEARAALSTTIELYQAMEMTFWLPQAEAALAQVQAE